jgi:hypothetical protein
MAVQTVDRRDLQSRAWLRLRVGAQFDESPSLSLTPAQAASLFGLREDVVLRVLGELEKDGLVRRASENRYAGRLWS